MATREEMEWYNRAMEKCMAARNGWEARIRSQIDKEREYDRLNKSAETHKAISLNYIYEYAWNNSSLSKPPEFYEFLKAESGIPPNNGVMKTLGITVAGGVMTYPYCKT